MTASTLTFAVQVGSGGIEIARGVAAALRYSYYDWEVTSAAARLAGVSPEMVAAAERAPSLLERIMERLLATGAYSEDEGLSRLSAATMASAIRSLDSQHYREVIENAVGELADRGKAVIVGHAGQVVLRNRAGVLKVLVRGSAPVRAERLAQDEGLSLDQALAAVRESDQERKGFFRRVYGIDLLDASHYDLALSVDEISREAAVALILEAASALPGFVEEPGPATD